MRLNMKRLLSVSLIAILTMTLAIPMASAYTGGLIDGQTVRIYTDSTTYTTTTNVTDNDTATNVDIWSSNRQKKVVKVFDNPVDITSFYADYQTTNGNDLRLYFYSEYVEFSGVTNATLDPSFLGQEIMTTTTPVSRDVDYQNVKMVIFHSNSSNTTLLKELDFFGTVNGPDTIPPANVGSLSAVGQNMAVDLAWTNPTDDDFSHVKIYRDGTLIEDNYTLDTYTDTGLINDQVYTYKVTTVDTTGNESTGQIKNIAPTNTDSQAPANVTNLIEETTADSITLSYDPVTDPDFSHYVIYMDGVEYDTTTLTSYTITGLDEATSYSFKITSVDTNGNESVGVIRSVTTLNQPDLVAPNAPTGLTAINANSGVSLDWENNLETDLDGYNVYIDGTKANTTPIRSSYYVLNGLTNAVGYTITVTAVDTSGNESPASEPITVTPSEDAMPLISLGGYDLGDVADGVSVWFGSLWLILAFSVAIPLAFYIANRVKLLFIA